ncbi:MAG: zinc ribbon domain-containing protein [Chloroflexota bacterium]
MAQKSLGYVRLVWHCPQCDSKVPGPVKTCGNCGFPQPEDVAFEQPAQETLITDESEIAQAKAGPDVHCFYCDTRNPGTAQTCSQCGATLIEGNARESGQVLGAHRDQEAQPVTCASCGTDNNPDADKCVQCGASLRFSAPPPAPASKAAPKTKAPTQKAAGIPKFAIIGVVIFACIIIGALGFFLTRTEEAAGQVQSVHWVREVQIEQLTPVTKEDWQDQIPSDAPVGVCTLKVRRTQDSPTTNSIEVCGTPYTKDTGSGFGEVVQDCQYQVQENWCEFTVLEWAEFDTIRLEGDDFNPEWPALTLNNEQREGTREEQYQCIFQTADGRRSYTTSDINTYNQCQPGSSWILEVNALGGVQSIQPPR